MIIPKYAPINEDTIKYRLGAKYKNAEVAQVIAVHRKKNAVNAYIDSLRDEMVRHSGGTYTKAEAAEKKMQRT